jgi:hypothetical protein
MDGLNLPPLNIIPNRDVRIPLAWLIYAVILIASLSVGYGGFRAGYSNQALETADAKSQIVGLHTDITSLQYELGRLKQSVDDLKESIDRKK